MPKEATTPATVPALPARAAAMHKGEAGKLFVVAGSAGMVGAAALCSRAALRSGAGLVRVGMPWRLAVMVSGRDPNVMTFALPETEDGTLSAMSPARILKGLEDYDVLCLGPGISTNAQTVQAVRNLLPQLDTRLLLDADGLNAIAGDLACLKDFSRAKGPPILTPHPGEMLRLLGKEADTRLDLRASDDQRRDTAVAFARKHNAVVVLKGRGTVVTDGKRVYVNQTGNPGMAKAGMGDVLAGVIGAMLAQGFEAFEAACLGAYLHGLAGDMVCARMGEIGMLATDVIEELPHACTRHQSGQK
ncbi:MAG: NAD(P)H-hydrate dehydratase [Planctomycetes bacterium]|jgi:NAD(P)H-hydrate epimerase|nr:NAD(P)H-hydrate dehydratase [Planctomycetota bacterium]